MKLRFLSRFPLIKTSVGLLSVSLSGDPLADIWFAIHQRNVIRFALSEKIDAVLTRQSHVLEVENDAAILLFHGDERFQVGDAVFVDPAAQGENDVPVRVPLNSQQFRSLRCRKQVERQAEVAANKHVDEFFN